LLESRWSSADVRWGLASPHNNTIPTGACEMMVAVAMIRNHRRSVPSNDDTMLQPLQPRETMPSLPAVAPP
jgi:hypothetical protein